MSLTVKVRHPKGGMCFGKIVRYEEALDRSPFYVIDIGEYQSLKVPAHIVEKDNKFEVHQEVKNILGNPVLAKHPLYYVVCKIELGSQMFNLL